MADFGTDEGGGFNAISRSYKNDPTIEHYVKLRAKTRTPKSRCLLSAGWTN